MTDEPDDRPDERADSGTEPVTAPGPAPEAAAPATPVADAATPPADAATPPADAAAPDEVAAQGEAAAPAETAPDAATGRLVRAARVRGIVVRAGSAALVVALAGAAAAAGEVVPVAEPSGSAAQVVDVPPPDQRLVCPGPVRLGTEPEPGEDVAYDPQFDPAPQDVDQGLVAVLLEGASLAVGELGGNESDAGQGGDQGRSGDRAVVLEDLDAGRVVVARSAGRPAEVTGSFLASAGEGDLAGLVAAPCRAGSAESWLVGGATELGSSARLVLQNPGRTPASVELTLWGAAGPVEVSGAPEFLVPPGTERVVLLEGLAAEQRRLVVRTRSRGGLVTAYLQDSRLRGLVPAGVAYVTPGVGPVPSQVLTAVQVPATEADGEDAAAVRLLAPEVATTARLTFLGPDGPAELPGAAEVRLDAGAVLDVPLSGLPAGVWTVVVDSDDPVVAGALVTRGEGVGLPAGGAEDAPLDRAWVPSVVPGPAGALATSVGAALVLASVPTEAGTQGRAVARVRMWDETGEELGTAEWPVPEGTTVRVSPRDLRRAAGSPVAAVSVDAGDHAVVWGLVLVADEGDGVAVLVPAPTAPGTTSVEVRVG